MDSCPIKVTPEAATRGIVGAILAMTNIREKPISLPTSSPAFPLFNQFSYPSYDHFLLTPLVRLIVKFTFLFVGKSILNLFTSPFVKEVFF